MPNFLLFLDEKTERTKDLLCVGDKAEKRACAPFWCRLVLTGEFWAERRCWSTEEGERGTATSATVRERLLLVWWFVRRLTAVFTKNRLATISFLYVGW